MFLAQLIAEASRQDWDFNKLRDRICEMKLASRLEDMRHDSQIQRLRDEVQVLRARVERLEQAK